MAIRVFIRMKTKWEAGAATRALESPENWINFASLPYIATFCQVKKRWLLDSYYAFSHWSDWRNIWKMSNLLLGLLASQFIVIKYMQPLKNVQSCLKWNFENIKKILHFIYILMHSLKLDFTLFQFFSPTSSTVCKSLYKVVWNLGWKHHQVEFNFNIPMEYLSYLKKKKVFTFCRLVCRARPFN